MDIAQGTRAAHAPLAPAGLAPAGLATAARWPALVLVDQPSAVSPRWWHRAAVLAEDVAWLLALGVLLPLAILVVGTPVALAGLALSEFIKWL